MMVTETKKQTDIKKLVGRIGNDYYICDYLFKHSDGFKGATATVLCPVSSDHYTERTDPESEIAVDYFEEIWRESVKAGNTTQSLKEFVEEVLAVDGDEAVFDLSGYEYWGLIREAEPELNENDYPVFECIGGGRSFDPKMKWDKLYDKQLWQKIKEIES